MQTFVSFILVGACTLALPDANAAVLHFDDLVGEGEIKKYGGLSWTGWQHVDVDQNPYTAASGRTRLFNLSNNNYFQSNKAFTFHGAQFAGYATVSYQLYLNGQLVALSDALTTSDLPTYLASGYSGLVDKVNIVADLPQYFVMDNVAVSGVDPFTVAEPGTLTLLLGAIGAISLLRTRP